MPVDVEATVLPGKEGGGEGGDEWVLGDGQRNNLEGLLLSGSTSDISSGGGSVSADSNNNNSIVDSDDELYVSALPDGGFAQGQGLAAQGQGLASTPVFGGPNRLANEGQGQGQSRGGGMEGSDASGSSVKYKKGISTSKPSPLTYFNPGFTYY